MKMMRCEVDLKEKKLNTFCPPSKKLNNKQTHPPTCVSHACSIRWTNASTAISSSSRSGVSGGGSGDSGRPPPDVVVVCGNRLSVYSVRVPGDDDRSRRRAGAAAAAASVPTEALDRARLELVCDFSLAGTPTSVCTLPARAPAPGLQRDALVLTFREAKAVVLDWDEAHCCPRPSSLHLLSRGDGTTKNAGGGGGGGGGDNDSEDLAAALLPRAHARANCGPGSPMAAMAALPRVDAVSAADVPAVRALHVRAVDPRRAARVLEDDRVQRRERRQRTRALFALNAKRGRAPRARRVPPLLVHDAEAARQRGKEGDRAMKQRGDHAMTR